jgi:hypothetical protein
MYAHLPGSLSVLLLADTCHPLFTNVAFWTEFGLRKEGSKFFISNSDVTVDANSDLYIKDKHFKSTQGLWKLLTRKSVNKNFINKDDLKQYKNILNLTSAHLEGYEPDAPIHVSRGIKFKTVIEKLFP